MNFYRLGITGSDFEEIKKELKKHLTNKGDCGILALSKDKNKTEEGNIMSLGGIIGAIICVVVGVVDFIGTYHLVNH